MESEESRPGSSASNSSVNSSENSRHSSISPMNEDGGPKSPPEDSAQSAPSSGDERRGSRSRSPSASACVPGLSTSPHLPLFQGLPQSANSPRSSCSVRSVRSSYKSESDSSISSSSENEDDDAKSIGSVTGVKNKASSSDTSESGAAKRDCSTSGIQSPTKSRRSSRNSSSSNRSCSNSPDMPNVEGGGININHEDLSDVSDLESEKRGSLYNSKQSEDEGTNISSVVASIPDDGRENAQTKLLYSLETDNSQDAVITDLRQKLDQKKNQLKTVDNSNEKSISLDDDDDILNGNNGGEALEDLVKTHDEDALDFEAEEGECQDVKREEDKIVSEKVSDGDKACKKNDKSDGEAEEEGELEEGEVSDEDEKRPEETEPKPVCRFYTRGQCTWGMSCRFLHPGVTDKGNYTMFDLVRPVPVPQGGVMGSRAPSYASHSGDYHDYRTERPSLHHRAAMQHPASVYTSHHDIRPALPEGPVVVESAWERGLRTAKEMMRKASKRKEQDMDFEDKKMNLTLSPDELEKDPYYLKERASTPDKVIPPFGRHVYQEGSGDLYSPPDRFGRGPPGAPYDEIDPYGRTNRYRELPPHRMPQYEDERRVRPTREVIVQRVEPIARGDEWNDPWMRSKSPGRGGSRDKIDKRRRDHRSYSSNSSYSSSSSSQTDSSSDSSRSPSPVDHRRRYNTSSHKSPPLARRHGVRTVRSPSIPLRRSKHSPTIRHSPIAKRRPHMSPSPVLDKRNIYSPVHKRKKLSPIVKKTIKEKVKAKRNRSSSSSGSGSSDSSGSDSDSDSGSSSSGSSSQSRKRTSLKRPRGPEKLINDRKMVKKVEPPKKRSPISIEIRKPTTVGVSALTSPTHSINSEKDPKKSRREELLKQLRAVEDAIAKKRSKLA